jgi:hypothetical protein
LSLIVRGCSLVYLFVGGSVCEVYWSLQTYPVQHQVVAVRLRALYSSNIKNATFTTRLFEML